MSDAMSYRGYSLIKIPYGISVSGIVGEEIRNFCLARKQELAREPGFAAHSCCCAVLSSEDEIFFGNSQQVLCFNKGPSYKHAQIKAHAEKHSIVQLIEALCSDTSSEIDLSSLVKELYIELSPCENCGDFLDAVLGNVPVYYSFDYSSKGIADWKKAASELCSAE